MPTYLLFHLATNLSVLFSRPPAESSPLRPQRRSKALPHEESDHNMGVRNDSGVDQLSPMIDSLVATVLAEIYNNNRTPSHELLSLRQKSHGSSQRRGAPVGLEQEYTLFRFRTRPEMEASKTQHLCVTLNHGRGCHRDLTVCINQPSSRTRYASPTSFHPSIHTYPRSEQTR